MSDLFPSWIQEWPTVYFVNDIIMNPPHLNISPNVCLSDCKVIDICDVNIASYNTNADILIKRMQMSFLALRHSYIVRKSVGEIQTSLSDTHHNVSVDYALTTPLTNENISYIVSNNNLQAISINHYNGRAFLLKSDICDDYPTFDRSQPLLHVHYKSTHLIKGG